MGEPSIKRVVDRYLGQYWQQKKLEGKEKLEDLKEKANYNYRCQLLSLLLEHYREYQAGSEKRNLLIMLWNGIDWHTGRV